MSVALAAHDGRVNVDFARMSESHEWLLRLLWTTVIIGATYGAGHLIRIMGSKRLGRIAARSSADWDEVLIAEITRRIPFWSLLVGAYLALGHWPLSVSDHLIVTRVLSALGVASVTFALAAVCSRLVATYGPRASPSAPVSGLTQNIVRIVVTLLGMLVIVKSIGYDITPMLTALGVGGLAVALALQEPLSNLFAGIFVALAGQIRIGDYIRLDSGAEGYVADFNWRSTRLRQLGDNMVVVPNSKLAQAVVTNYDLPTSDMGIGVDVTVDVSSDLEQVERVALDVAAGVLRDVPGVVASAAPSVRFSSFADEGVRFSVGVRVRTFVDQFLVKHELIKRLHSRFLEEGIVMPVESRTTLVRDKSPAPS
jgi:small-conductance mechanosensitive channel